MRAVRIFAVFLAAALLVALANSPVPSVQTPAAPAAGDATRGKEIFESTKGNCLSCHNVNGIGSLFGPDLTSVGASGERRGGIAAKLMPPASANPQQLAQSIVDPNADVSPQNRYMILEMRDGRTITGKLLSVDTFYYQLFDSSENLASISKEDVRKATMTSPMPSYKDKLTTEELADVVRYLLSLKGQ